MKRPWQVWLVFVACVGGAAAAMAWLTREALQSDQLRRTAQATAELEQRVSLALWRMDTELAPIIAEEVVRPPAAYRTRLLASEVDVQQRAGGRLQVYQQPPLYVLLQFEVLSDGSWHSPQAPQPELPSQQVGGPSHAMVEKATSRLASLSDSIRFAQLLAELPTTSLPALADVGSHLLAQGTIDANDGRAAAEPLQYFEGNQAAIATKGSLPAKSSASSAGKVPLTAQAADFERRSLRYQHLAEQTMLNSQRQAGVGAVQPIAPWKMEKVGVARPIWVDDRLLLARRVKTNGETSIQGSWLDWPLLKSRLLGEAEDLMPDADLLPMHASYGVEPNRMLAGLPVRLVTGPAVVAEGTGPALRWALWIGWAALALAAVAAAALLHGVMALSERRAAFVSSVTHELRTPLTTFRMYAEMLAQNMVPNAERRQEYLRTLQCEAQRLTLLVENVLAYARLERGRKPDTAHRTTVDGLFERMRHRLEHRAQEANMQCVFRVDDANGQMEFATDANVVEQILFNLVDNAAKYAGTADDRRIHVEARREPHSLVLSVRDHGPGIPAQYRSTKLRAFFKTAEQSAESAHGVGLGLALCRRLARQLGGGLEIHARPGGGTIASLELPVE